MRREELRQTLEASCRLLDSEREHHELHSVAVRTLYQIYVNGGIHDMEQAAQFLLTQKRHPKPMVP